MTHLPPAPQSYNTALRDAALKGHTPLVNSLINCKANINHALCSAVIADSKWSGPLVEALIRYKASVDLKDNELCVPICCKKFKETQCEHRQEYILDVLKALLKNKADPDPNNGNFPLYQPTLIEVCTRTSLAHKSPYRKEAVKLLLEHKANPNCLTNDDLNGTPAGLSPVSLLIMQHNEEDDDLQALLRLLIRHKADVNPRIIKGPFRGFPPLHKLITSYKTRRDTIQMLLNAGANPHITVPIPADTRTENALDLLTFQPYNIDDNVCKRLENLWTLRKSLNKQECDRRLEDIKEDIPSRANKRKAVQYQWDMRCLLEEYMQSPKTPDDRRRLYFSKFCWRDWARVLVSPYRAVACNSRATKRSPLGGGDTDNDNIVQLRAFLQSLNKDRQRGYGTKIIQYCSAC